MEKKNLDRRLAQSLQSHEQKPRPQAWQELQNRLGHETSGRRVAPLWYYGVAASVAIMLLVGYVFWPESQPKMPTSVAAQTHPRLPLKGRSAQPGKQNRVLPEAQPGSTGRQAIQLARQLPARKSHRAEVEVITPGSTTTAIPFEQVSAVPNQPKPLPEPTPEPTEVAVVPTPQAEVPQQPAQTVLVVRLTGPEPNDAGAATPRRRARLGRVLRQLYAAKNGERVDWREVGFNPNTLLARAGEKLERSADKATQTYQSIKEKTNF